MYLQFSSILTNEEITLQAKYKKLLEKKKALQEHKKPKQEPERAPQLPKRPADAKDAREMAKKLLQSGAITKKRDEQSFKRPLGLERKLNSMEKTVPSSYQPFSEIQNNEELPQAKKPKIQNLYNNFVKGANLEDRGTNPVPKKSAKGNTIFVYGIRLSEDLLKEHFSVFGSIVNISIENEKKGFITFKEPKSAEEAINQMDGTTVASINLQVSMAKRQPVILPKNTTDSSTLWSSAAATYDRRGTQKDKRDLQVYQDNLFE